MHAEQEKLQGATARAQERASQVMGQNEQRLESAFWLLSLVLTILGSFILFVPDKASPWHRPHLVLPVCNLLGKIIIASLTRVLYLVLQLQGLVILLVPGIACT